ncbi:MAG: translation initiation factor [Anaerolineales bacterium]|nr:translation initiation factor [Anaerolineales bacterium]
MSNKSKTVWSSEEGDLRKKALTPSPLSSPKGTPSGRGGSLPPQQQTIYLHRESSGRAGKAVTLVKKLILSEDDLKALAKKLKQECGTGGTIKDGVIEIQGEHREKIADVLQKLGYKVKIAGG